MSENGLFCEWFHGALAGHQEHYCSKSCASSGSKWRKGKIARRSHFDPTDIESFYVSESKRRKERTG